MLAESELLTDLSAIGTKGNAEVQVSRFSLLFPQNVAQNIWTIGEKQVTVYTESGAKIFSKNAADEHDLDLESIYIENNG